MDQLSTEKCVFRERQAIRFGRFIYKPEHEHNLLCLISNERVITRKASLLPCEKTEGKIREMSNIVARQTTLTLFLYKYVNPSTPCTYPSLIVPTAVGNQV